MAEFSEVQHPTPKGEIPFQSFCLKLVRRYWNDDLADIHGRRGQSQDGADIRGRDNRNGFVNAGFQCKGSDTHEPRALTIEELEAEVTKAKGFSPPLDIFYVAYAGKRDAEIQKRAKALSTENEAAGLFRIEVWSWDDIVARAENFPDVAAELLVRAGAPLPAATLSPKRPKTDKFTALENMRSAISDMQAAITDDSHDTQSDDPVTQGKIDIFRDQIRTGDGKVAIKGLRAIIGDLNSDTPARVRFRAYANLGAALTQAGEFEQAAVAFDEAAAAEFETAEGKAYEARAALTRRNSAKAFSAADKALGLDSKQKIAAAIFIDTAPDNLATADIEKRVAEILTDSDVGWGLSRRYSLEGNHDEALRVARAIDQKDENWTRDIAIGDAIVNRFEKDYATRVGAPPSPKDEALLHEAAELLQRAWKRIIERADRKNWAHVGANAAAACQLIGEAEKSDALTWEAFTFAPDLLRLKGRAAIALMRKKDFVKALELASEVAEAGESEEALLASSLATSSKRWDLVRKWGQKAFDQAKDDDVKARAAELLVLAEYREKDATAALTLADSLRATFAASVTFESRAAEIARRLGDAIAMEEARKRVEAFDPSTLNALELFELSDAYSDNGNWSNAADLLEGLHTNDRPSELLNRHLYALYRANRRSDARKLYESLGDAALKSKEVRRLGAAIYEQSGMLSHALSCLDAALKLDSNDLRSRLDWARMQLRSGNDKKVSKWIKKAAPNLEGEAEDQMELAQLLARFRRDKEALSLGYKVLRKNWGKSEPIHLAYYGLFLLRGGPKNKDHLHPSQVAEDTVVFLQNAHGGKVDYRIEAGDLGANVLSPEHAFAKQLEGAKVGETRETPPGIGEPQTWTVTAIKDKHVDLFHRSFEQHATLFPGSHALGSFHIEPEAENGFEPIFEQVRTRAKHADEVSQLYEEQLIPVDVVGKLLGVDGIDASLGLRARAGKRFDNCVGLQAERAAAIHQLRNAQRIIVDYITLSIWNDIGLLGEIEKDNKPQVNVVQSTIDALAMRSETAAQSLKQKGGSLVLHGDKIALVEPTDANRKLNAEKWAKLEKWAREHTTILPIEPLRVVPGDSIAELLPPAAVDSIATAAACKAVFVSEDRRLRIVAASYGVAAAAWTQPLLMAMLEEGNLTREKYVELLTSLQRQRVGFVSVGTSDLLSAIDAGREGEFPCLAEALTGSSVDPKSVALISEEVVRQLWMNPKYVLNRERHTSEILNSLLSQRRVDALQLIRVIVHFTTNEIRASLFPMNILYLPWSKYVEDFLRGHFLQDVILK